LKREDKIVRNFDIRVRDLRGQKRSSQERLLVVAGIHRTYCGGIETARRNPSLRNIIKIALALGVPVKELFEL
jgi:transcriptional regulator with XRE-family HTH domain